MLFFFFKVHALQQMEISLTNNHFILSTSSTLSTSFYSFKLTNHFILSQLNFDMKASLIYSGNRKIYKSLTFMNKLLKQRYLCDL